MRVMILVKANQESEKGALPPPEIIGKIIAFNEELVKAGVMLAADGLQPSAKGVRVKFAGKEPAVTQGPFAETEQLVAGYWIWQVHSLEDAIHWLKRAPFGGGVEIEIRPLLEHDEFDRHLAPELVEREQRLRAKVAEGAKAAKP